MKDDAGPARSNFEPSGFFVFRTPLLPLERLAGLSTDLMAAAALASDGDLESAIEHDYQLVAERLRTCVSEPAIREALFIASPSLDSAIRSKWTDERFPAPPGVLNSVIRYFAR